MVSCLQQIVFWAGATQGFVVYDLYDEQFCTTQAVLVQFLFVSEILQVSAIFFYTERLVVGTVSITEIRRRYLVSW